jgi:predicted RND superfamily exporter protein
VISILDVIAVMHRALPGMEGRIPAEKYKVYIGLLKQAAGKDLARAVDLEGGTLRLAVRLNTDGLVETHETGLAVEALSDKFIKDSAQVEVTGISYLVGYWIQTVVEMQRNGLGLSFALIAVMMIIGLGSLRVGIGSMLPNILPLLAIGGFLGLAWDQVDSDTFVVGMLAIGIGVDDTIHFLMRYKIEARRTSDRALALERTFSFAGRAIVMTTVILVIGFLPYALSDYYSINMLGTLLPAVLIIALAADLMTVPALVRLGWIDFTKKKTVNVRRTLPLEAKRETAGFHKREFPGR